MEQNEFMSAVMDFVKKVMKPKGKTVSVEQVDDVTYIVHTENGPPRTFFMGPQARAALEKAYKDSCQIIQRKPDV